MKNLPALFLLFLLCGCTAPHQSSPPSAERTYDATKAVVWPRLVSAITSHYPVKVLDQEEGLITTDPVQLPCGFTGCEMIRWAYPPNVIFPQWAGLRMNLTAMVSEPEAGRTRVSIRTHYEAFDNGETKNWIVCDSTGSLEKEILNQLPP